MGEFLTAYDLHLLAEGTHWHAYEKLGAHPGVVAGVEGTQFVVLAPNAAGVSVIGDFNRWEAERTPLRLRPEAGIWEGFVAGVRPGARYKYAVRERGGGRITERADPYAFFAEVRPRTASIVWDLDGYAWQDAAWMAEREKRQQLDAPLAIYEVHVGSWARVPDEEGQPLSYRELAPKLAAYLNDMGYSHVELLPVAEYPLDDSWGYQVTGYFAPTSRYGTPDDFRHLVDTLHQAGIGVLMDWVPAHFAPDGHGLPAFDGTCLYEHADPRLGQHPDWGSVIFNYGRVEVRNLLIANALFWLERYHLDGLRVDAVASMLYRDYSRPPTEWIPNAFGGRENLEAIDFLRRLNEKVYEEHPSAMTVAEESTAWPLVSRPTYVGGLGFGYKWNMGWMHDMLQFMARDPIHRRHHLNELTFSLLYAHRENFILPLSHDEVVHGKSSILGKMPGDAWQKFANVRLLYGLMYGHPGKKLLFMGNDIGQWDEWDFRRSLDWHLLLYAPHAGLQRWVRDLNRLYRTQAALFTQDYEPAGFQWVDCSDTENVVVSFLRRGRAREDVLLFVCNFTPVPRVNYRVGVPEPGRWSELLNSDAEEYGGSGLGNLGGVEASPMPMHGLAQSLSLALPPLAVLVLRPGAAGGAGA